MFDMLPIFAPLPLFAAQWHSDLVFALPLIVVVSLVYAATRQEQMEAILHYALRLGTMISLFMGVIFVLLALLSWIV